MEFIPFLVGVVFGTIITALISHRKKPSGTLKIDHSNLEKDIYRFEIHDLDGLNKQKKIVLKVDNNANLSQK
jgi:hypothetical protein